jgi:hypothetical protein
VGYSNNSTVEEIKNNKCIHQKYSSQIRKLTMNLRIWKSKKKSNPKLVEEIIKVRT